MKWPMRERTSSIHEREKLSLAKTCPALPLSLSFGEITLKKRIRYRCITSEIKWFILAKFKVTLPALVLVVAVGSEDAVAHSWHGAR
jgi:hypothetical protein